jgi:hypothetical protein
MARTVSATETYFARIGQIALGLLWLADGALQFQPYMFGRTFVTGVILPASQGQPAIIGGPIVWMAKLIEPHVALFNAGAATLEVLIGVGLLYRSTVKVSLLISFAWAIGIWFAGEGLGMIFTGTASPLTGAPGAALLYLLAGLICWPREGGVKATRRDVAVRWCWSAIWLGAAVLWLLPANDTATSTHDAIATAPSGAGWLSETLTFVARAVAGRGTAVALALAAVSVSIGLSALYRWHTRFFLALAIAVSAGYWIVGQGIGGVFTGQATDPGSGPVMIIIASMLVAQEHDRELTARERFVPRRAPRKTARSTAV